MCALWFTMGKTDKLPRDFCHFGFIRKLNQKKTIYYHIICLKFHNPHVAIYKKICPCFHKFQ
jgi:hypothetical protein